MFSGSALHSIQYVHGRCDAVAQWGFQDQRQALADAAIPLRYGLSEVIASNIGIATDASVSGRTLVELVVASLIIALPIALTPAVRAARLPPAKTLRGE